MNNKFINTNDEKISNVAGFDLPNTWWSRPYEYKFASDFIKDEDVVIDAACGLEHPFKMLLAEKCKKVYALDIDKKILELKPDLEKLYDNMIVINGNVTETHKLVQEKADKIYCISVLEHLNQKDVKAALESFREVLKDSGLIILTVDYPFLKPFDLKRIAKQCNLKIVGDEDYIINNQIVLKAVAMGLKCYTMVLSKQLLENEETTIIERLNKKMEDKRIEKKEKVEKNKIKKEAKKSVKTRISKTKPKTTENNLDEKDIIQTEKKEDKEAAKAIKEEEKENKK